MSDTPDPNAPLPGGLTVAQFQELHAKNPFAAARYARAHGVNVVTPNHPGNGAARLAALRPAAPPPVDLSTLTPDEQALAELQKTNPFLAARVRAAKRHP